MICSLQLIHNDDNVTSLIVGGDLIRLPVPEYTCLVSNTFAGHEDAPIFSPLITKHIYYLNDKNNVTKHPP